MKRLILISTTCAMSFSMASGLCADKILQGRLVEQEYAAAGENNTGFSYWLELKGKNGVVQRCSNKTVFHNGDKIRIHMKSDVDGYAYIVMMEGSKGDKEVLFPNEDLGNNKVKAGTYITLPVPSKNDTAAWLKFDEHPGTELLRMIVSRKEIDAEQQLHEGSVVLSDSSASADEVPDDTKVSINVSRGTEVKSGLRNLVIDHDSKPENEGETKVVAEANKLLAVDIALTHEAGRK